MALKNGEARNALDDGRLNAAIHRGDENHSRRRSESEHGGGLGVTPSGPGRIVNQDT